MIESDLTPAERFEALLARLESQHGICRVAADRVDRFAAGPGDSVLLLTDAPNRCPEAWDMAVVLPEALRAMPGEVRGGIADPQASTPVAARFGVARLPALLFLRDGGYVGVLEGMRDWADLVPAARAMLDAPVGRVPGIGVAVRAAPAGSCH